MFVSIGEASILMGVAVSTLRRWEKEDRFLPKFRTKGNHRRYCMNEIQEIFLFQNSFSKIKQNMIELMTVFCAKIYGRRSHSNRKKAV